LYERVMRGTWKTVDNVVFVKTLTDKSSIPKSEAIGFRNADVADMPWLCRNMAHLGSKAELILGQQFVGNDVTIIGMTKEQPDVLAFSAWLSHDDFGLSLLGGDVAPGDVSVRRVWVPPIMRKRGFASLGMEYAEHAAMQVRARRIWSFVEVDNIPSIGLHKKGGYSEFGHVKLKMRFGTRLATTIFNDSRRSITQEIPTDKAKL
jgi:hypothetical protein